MENKIPGYKPFKVPVPSIEDIKKAVEDDSTEKLIDDHKELVEAFGGPETSVEKNIPAVEKAIEDGFVIGKTVEMKNNKGKVYGEIVGYRNVVGGMYPGDRYPILIKRDDGMTFEYCTDSWEIVGDDDLEVLNDKTLQ